MVKFQLGKRIDRFLINQIGVNEVHLYSSSALGSVKAGLDATKIIGKGGDRLIEISEAISSKAPITSSALANAGSILKLSELPPQFIQNILPETQEEVAERRREEMWKRRQEASEFLAKQPGFQMETKSQTFRGAKIGTRTSTI